MSSRQTTRQPGRPRPVHDSGLWLLAVVAGMTAAILLAATGRFEHLPIMVETAIAVALGLLTMFALAPWRQIVGRARDRQDLRTLTRSVRQFDHDHDREPLRSLAVRLTQRALARADANEGRRGPWLRLLDRLGLGFDS